MLLFNKLFEKFLDLSRGALNNEVSNSCNAKTFLTLFTFVSFFFEMKIKNILAFAQFWQESDVNGLSESS